MNNDAVLHEKKNHITYITLNRPESHNSMNVDTLDQLSATLLGCKRDDDCRAIIVTGAGDKFSAGADPVSYTHLRRRRCNPDHL